MADACVVVDPDIIKILSPFLIAIGVTGISIWGWFKTSKLNRENELFKQRLAERLKRRLIMFDSVNEAIVPFIAFARGTSLDHVVEVNSKLERARINVQLYGNDEEIKKFEDFIGAVNESRRDDVGILLAAVIQGMRKNFREELGYAK